MITEIRVPHPVAAPFISAGAGAEGAMSKNSGPRYKGKLNKQLSPLPTWAHPAIHSKSEINQDSKREIAERFHLLFRHHDLDPSDPDRWYTLAVRLAVDHVPGFQKQRRGGNKGFEWDYLRERQLYENVGSKMTEGHSAKRACYFLARKPEYKKLKGETLRRKFEEVRSRFQKIDRHNAKTRREGHRPYPTTWVDRNPLRFPPSARAADNLIRTWSQLDNLDEGSKRRAKRRLMKVARKP